MGETRPDGRMFLYDYDHKGNRTSVSHNGQSVSEYTYDAANRLTQYETFNSGSPLDTFSYTYNGLGDRRRGRR